jgi:hypothetical protein
MAMARLNLAEGDVVLVRAVVRRADPESSMICVRFALPPTDGGRCFAQTPISVDAVEGLVASVNDERRQPSRSWPIVVTKP